jgi:hypothetical protein
MAPMLELLPPFFGVGPGTGEVWPGAVGVLALGPDSELVKPGVGVELVKLLELLEVVAGAAPGVRSNMVSPVYPDGSHQ